MGPCKRFRMLHELCKEQIFCPPRHKAGFLEQSWLHVLLVCRAVPGVTSCTPAWVLGKDALPCLSYTPGPRGPGETEEPVGGCRVEEKQQVPATELGKCIGCWLLGAWGGSGRWAEELGHEQRCGAVGLRAGW